MSLRERNNAASRKCHEKSMEQLYATAYEHAIVMKHITDHPESQVHHWSHVPEEWLEEAGYITSYNEHRLKRLMAKKESMDGVNRLKDYGADAMSKTPDGAYHLLQAKYYKTSCVTASDIGSFIASFMSLKIYHPTSKGYLYTSSRLQADLAGFMAHPQYPINHIPFPWTPPDKRYETKKVRIPLDCDHPLRDYQVAAYHELRGKDGIHALHIPCRMGKTIISGHIIRDRQPRLLVVMAPLKISVQNLRDSHRLASFLPNYKSLLVDSDAEGTTDRNTVLAFLETDGPHVIYTTYESALSVVATIPGIETAYVLVDEVHNVSTDHITFLQRFSHGLVMSATLPDILEDLLELKIIVRIPFSKGIQDKYLTDYSIWLPFLAQKEDTGETYAAIDIPEAFQHDDQTLTAQAMYLATVMLKTGARRCIVYLSRQEDCARFMDHAIKVFETYHGITIWTNKIDSTVSHTERTQRIHDFQKDDELAPFRLLTSVRILDEAVDIPRCDSVFITSVGEYSSDIRMTQRAMRGSTLDPSYPSKRNHIIVWANGWEQCVNSLEGLREADPLFHKKIRVTTTYDQQGASPHTSEIHKQILEQEQHARQYMVISCMSAWERQKMRWIAICKKLGRTPSITSKDLEESRSGKWQSYQRNAKKRHMLSQDRIDELEALDMWVWEDDRWSIQQQTWIEQYKRLKKCPCTNSDDIEEKKSASWQTNQRGLYRQGLLSQERIDQLENMDGWVWDASTWDENKNKWCDIYKLLGDYPSSNSKDPEERRLGQWQLHQRQFYKHHKLSQERIAILEELDGWVWEENTWAENVALWVACHSQVEQHADTHKRVKQWQAQQRRHFKDNKLSHERITILESLDGWAWEDKDTWPEQKDHWISVYTRLKIRLSTDDHTPPKINLSVLSTDPDEARAASWQSVQRGLYHKHILSQERIDQLNQLDGWLWEASSWSDHKERWISVYARKKDNPDDVSDLEKKKAKQWQSDQRKYFKKQVLSQEHINQLEKIPEWKWEKEDTWSEKKRLWIEYYNRVGNSPPISSKDPEIQRIARWQHNVRSCYKHGTLDQKRIDTLNEVPGWAWSAT
jgi:superfamily II DNA or RNA helicase